MKDTRLFAFPEGLLAQDQRVEGIRVVLGKLHFLSERGFEEGDCGGWGEREDGTDGTQKIGYENHFVLGETAPEEGGVSIGKGIFWEGFLL